jgi:hypothetical protein
MFYVFSNNYGLTCIGCPTRRVGSVYSIGWDFYMVSFREIDFGHQEDVYFLGVEKYFDIFYALGQPVCNPRRYIVYVNCFTNLLSTVVRRFMSVLICSACLDKIVSNRVKDSCIILMNMFSCVLFVDIFGVFWSLGRILFPIFLRVSVLRKGFPSLVLVYLLLVEAMQILIYDFLIGFAASVASRMRFPTM